MSKSGFRLTCTTLVGLIPLSLVGTFAIDSFPFVTVPAKRLEIIWELLTNNGLVDVGAANSCPMCIAIVVDVVDGQELWMRFATAHASPTVVVKDLLTCVTVIANGACAYSFWIGRNPCPLPFAPLDSTRYGAPVNLGLLFVVETARIAQLPAIKVRKFTASSAQSLC